MAKGGGAIAGAIIGSVVISVILTGAGAYFLLPRLFPGMNGDPYIPYTPAFVYEEFDSTAQLNDDDLVYTMVPDTMFFITVLNDSRLICTFSGTLLIGLWNTLGTGEVKYELALGVEDNATYAIDFWKFVEIQYQDGDGVTGVRELSFACAIELVTVPLEAGVYRVSLWWKSQQNPTGFNYLLFHSPSFDFNRSLSALEVIA